MKSLKIVALAALLALTASAARAAGHEDNDKVTVINKDSSPVPVKVLSLPAVSISNTPSVNVANTPTVNVASLPPVTISGPVTVSGSISTAAAPTLPFTGGMHVSTPAGQVTGIGTFTVPAGKRAVIETVSIFGNMPFGASTASVTTQTNYVLGQLSSFPIPLTPGAFGSAGIAQVKLYADANTTVYCEVVTQNFQSQVDANCGFSGYLVDQP